MVTLTCPTFFPAISIRPWAHFRPTSRPDPSRPKTWDDGVAIYIGGQFGVTDPLALRLGFRWDPTPVPAETMGPELPDADKLYYCAGAGYKVRNWTFDLAYMYVDKKDRTVNKLNLPAGTAL